MADVLYGSVAQFYEALYRKNLGTQDGINAECDRIESILKRNASPISRILDMGCGTGVHAVELANRGYGVMAVDYAPNMLEIAKARPMSPGAEIEFAQGDMRKFSSARAFDAAICMTNAMLCNYTAGHIESALSSFARVIRHGGVLLVEASCYGKRIARGEFAHTYLDHATTEHGAVYEVSENTHHPRLRQLHEKNRYFIARPDGLFEMHESENKLRLLDAGEFSGQLGDAGFEVAELIDEETNRPAGAKTSEYLIAAVRR